MGVLKLLDRSKEVLENEIKIVKTINKDANIKYGLEKCARMSLKW
jgi:hypothetical protein